MSGPTNRRLNSVEIESELASIPDWELMQDTISREWKFKTYKDGLVFAVAIGHLADQMDHHPDLTIGYACVSAAISTHSVGGLSPLDFELARRIDRLG